MLQLSLDKLLFLGTLLVFRSVASSPVSASLKISQAINRTLQATDVNVHACYTHLHNKCMSGHNSGELHKAAQKKCNIQCML